MAELTIPQADNHRYTNRGIVIVPNYFGNDDKVMKCAKLSGLDTEVCDCFER